MLRMLTSEALGTAFLLTAISGSAIIGTMLANGHAASALLLNAMAVGATLGVMITILRPVSGGHFNPAVSLVFYIRGELSMTKFIAYIGAQISGAMIGIWLSHAMFAQPIWQIAQTQRMLDGVFLSEIIATFGLVLIILGGLRANAATLPMIVGFYIMAASYFTSSGSFANPAVTIARGFSDNVGGIAPSDIAPFIGAQIIGALLAASLAVWLFNKQNETSHKQ